MFFAVLSLKGNVLQLLQTKSMATEGSKLSEDEQILNEFANEGLNETDPFAEPNDSPNVFDTDENGDEIEDFNVDEVIEQVRITPVTEAPFNVVKIKDITFIPKSAENEYPRMIINFRQKLNGNIAEGQVAVFNPFTQKVKTDAKGKVRDGRVEAVSQLKHFFGALTPKDTNEIGKLQLTKTNLNEMFQVLYDRFMALLPPDYTNTPLNLKLSYYKQNLTFPKYPPFVSSTFKPRLNEIKWNSQYDKDVPQGGSSGPAEIANDDDLNY